MPEETAPIVCTLSPNQFGDRLEEFHRLFAARLDRIERRDGRWLRLVLRAGDGDGIEDQVRDLLRREAQCCAFFDFGVTAAGDRLLVDARVPAGAEPTLDGLAGLARRATPEAVEARG